MTKGGHTSTAPCGRVQMTARVTVFATTAPATAMVAMLVLIAQLAVPVQTVRSAPGMANVKTELASALPDGPAMTATHARVSMTAPTTDTAIMGPVSAILVTVARIAHCPPLQCPANVQFAASAVV